MSFPELRSGIILSPDGILTSPDVDRNRSVAITLLVVGLDSRRNGDNQNDPLLWTIKELKDKQNSHKKAGEISIPAETRKIGEDRSSNLLGALSEFCNDDNLFYARKHLFVIDGLFIERGVNIKGNLVDVSVLLYDGSLDYPFVPLNNGEVEANSWLRRDQIQGAEGIRSVLSRAVELDIAAGLSSRAIELYYTQPTMMKPAFPINFKSMGQFCVSRELFPDIPLING